MKQIGIVFLLFIGLIGCADATNKKSEQIEKESVSLEDTLCDCKELIYDNGYNTYYMDKPKDGYTGVCQTYFKNGQVELRKNLLRGKTNGFVFTYYENGALKSLKEYDMNLQVGDHFAYSEDGRLIFFGKYNRGRLIQTIVSQPF